MLSINPRRVSFSSICALVPLGQLFFDSNGVEAQRADPIESHATQQTMILTDSFLSTHEKPVNESPGHDCWLLATANTKHTYGKLGIEKNNTTHVKFLSDIGIFSFQKCRCRCCIECVSFSYSFFFWYCSQQWELHHIQLYSWYGQDHRHGEIIVSSQPFTCCCSLLWAFIDPAKSFMRILAISCE